MLFLITNIVVFILFTILIGVATLYLYCQHKYSYWKKRGVYTPKPSFPFGNVWGMFQHMSFGEVHRKLYLELKASGHKHAGFYFGWRPTYFTLDPETFKAIMTKDFHHFVDRGNFVDEENDPLSGHLFSLEGQKWKLLRQKLTPTFTSGKMKMMFHTLMNCGDELVKVMDELATTSEPVDIKDLMARFTTDVIGSCAFGIECNSLQNPEIEFRVYGRKIFDPEPIDMVKGFLSLVCPELLKQLRIRLTNSKVEAFFQKMVRQTVDYREKNNIKRKDFMDLLIQLKNHGDLVDDENEKNKETNDSTPLDERLGNLTLNEITAQAFLFFVAGFETSSSTLQFAMYELAINQNIQERLRKEVLASIWEYDGKITYEGLHGMKYLDMFVSETLRIYPPVAVLIRQCTDEYKVPDTNITLEKGTSVFLPAWAVQMDPDYFPEPEKFDPERFSDERKSEQHPYTWLPFGEGPRNCIGMRFGLMQVKAAIALLVSKYKLSLNPKTKTPLKMDPKLFIFSPIGGIWIDFEKL